jgi:hypothetical protein
MVCPFMVVWEWVQKEWKEIGIVLRASTNAYFVMHK